ncbi:hypothetical protein PGT21_001229 [Puccinia graminis f. sp. tritici]|uniref:Uncharacterized protein n=1 Tax=Puccinia graminis f. sp. tritici TaxID=56615 RepID=A0A5B0LHT3_PUCGR|nr:hypothetical protein PGT21_001229 [Puccinia graminis f. sp. tritici]
MVVFQAVDLDLEAWVELYGYLQEEPPSLAIFPISPPQIHPIHSASMLPLRFRGRIKQAGLVPASSLILESIDHGFLSFRFNMSEFAPDDTAMTVDSPTQDTADPTDSTHVSSESAATLIPNIIEERDVAASFPIDPAVTSVSNVVDPNRPTHAYPSHQAAQVEEDEVPSYPPPPYVHAVRFASAGPYSTPATAGPPRSVLSHAPRRGYSTPRQAGSASPGSPTRPSVRRRLFPTSPAPTRAASPDDSPAPPTDPPAAPHPAPAGDPFDMDARFSAQFLAMSFYNTLLSVHDVLGDLPNDHPHFLRHEIMRAATIIAEDWFNYHRIHLPSQFAEPHSMGHLVANSVRFTLDDSCFFLKIPHHLSFF